MYIPRNCRIGNKFIQSENMGSLDFSAGHLIPTSSFYWLHFCLLLGSGKHISLQGAPVDATAHGCGPAGNAPLYYASQWERHRKVSVTTLLRMREAKHLASVSPLSLTQHIAMGTCPLWTSNGVSHAMQSVRKWYGHESVGELETGSIGETALYHVIFKVSSISSLGWLVTHLLSADDKNTLIGPDVCEHNIVTIAW